jgi:uroporphyrinogen decarboxylase
MTPREYFINALERKTPSGRVPTFELVFFLTMEAFGKVHPSHRNYAQWDQMEEKERQLHRKDMAQLYIDTAERFEHSAIFLHPNPGTVEESVRLAELVREISSDKYFLLLPGDATLGLPGGDKILEFSCKMADEPEKVKHEAEIKLQALADRMEKIKQCGCIDGFAMCSDYCFNDNPFLSPMQFDEFVTPYLVRQIRICRELGFYSIKHTDGNIMPILDSLLEGKPDALHSLDPQGGVDIAEMKKLAGDKVCLIGNVNCGLIDTGTLEETLESARYALKHGMPGGGYIFSTSNCVYTGMNLQRYEAILELWRQEGNYN